MNAEGVKDRLLAFLAEVGMSQAKFEKECGMSNGYVNNIRQSIQPDKLQRIALRFPALNIAWLMIGDIAGDEMLKIPRPVPYEQETKPKATPESVKIESLESQVASLTREKENYWQLIQKLTEK